MWSSSAQHDVEQCNQLSICRLISVLAVVVCEQVVLTNVQVSTWSTAIEIAVYRTHIILLAGLCVQVVLTNVPEQHSATVQALQGHSTQTLLDCICIGVLLFFAGGADKRA
jgi:hypothetical protein